MRVAVFLFVWLAALLWPVAGRAQVEMENRLRAFIDSEPYQKLLESGLGHIPPVVFKRCPSLVRGSPEISILRPVSFGADGAPNAGLWRHSFAVSGCGNDTVLNFFFVARPDGKLDPVIGLPGTTHADLVLQRDSVAYANAGAAVAIKGCREFYVTNTRFEGGGVPQRSLPNQTAGRGDLSHAWRESWTVAGCGHVADVPMEFVPDQSGTQIIQPGGAKQR